LCHRTQLKTCTFHTKKVRKGIGFTLTFEENANIRLKKKKLSELPWDKEYRLLKKG
jgi:hypothetical protein